MLTTTLLLSALMALSSSTSVRVQTIDANYDDIAAVPAVPAANVLTTYKGLNYSGFAVNQVGVGGAAQVAGVTPNFSPNNIVSGIQQTSTIGHNPGFNVSGTSSKAFDLLSLYYGCRVNTAEGAEGLPQQCTFNVFGYRKLNDANPVAAQQFSYNPVAGQIVAQPSKATFNAPFHGLQRVDYIMVESTSGEALNVLVLDDVTYRLYT